MQQHWLDQGLNWAVQGKLLCLSSGDAHTARRNQDKLDLESPALDYGLLGQCGTAPALSGRGRLRSHVFTTGPAVTGCCHAHLRRLYHYHPIFDHRCNGNQHKCTSSFHACTCGQLVGTSACSCCVIVCFITVNIFLQIFIFNEYLKVKFLFKFLCFVILPSAYFWTSPAKLSLFLIALVFYTLCLSCCFWYMINDWGLAVSPYSWEPKGRKWKEETREGVGKVRHKESSFCGKKSAFSAYGVQRRW